MKAGKSQDNKSPNNLCSPNTPKVCLLIYYLNEKYSH